VILYLDYDGVLHHCNVRLAQYGYGEARVPEMVEPSHELFSWAEILVRILDEEDPERKVKIILSTSWGYHFGIEAKSFLPTSLQERVIGKTDQSMLSRGEQILKHATKNGIERWIAIDDDRCRWPYDYQDRLVYCDSETGISDSQVQADLRGKLRDLVS
jgi:hypothetical protein